MEYIPIMLAFFSACVAINGDTWNASESGIKKLTRIGWIALFLISITFIYSVTTVYSAREKKIEFETDKERISKIINFEITKSLRRILSPFRHIYADHSSIYVPEEDITIQVLLEDINLKKAQGVCLQNRPKNIVTFPDSGTWNDIFRAKISSGIERLESLQNRYSQQMSSELLESIYHLVEDGHFSRYAWYRPIPISSEDTKNDKLISPTCIFSQMEGTHKEYLNMISRIYKANKSNVYQR
tara:strand:- start:4246 stop:4971 length:726 start_codon:yes stop_codon:yes gene_type:complete